MAEGVTKLPLKSEESKSEATAPAEWHPFNTLRREIDRLFDAFDGGFWRSPFGRSGFDIEPFFRREPAWPALPAVDVAENDKGFEITAEMPGMEEKNIEVKVVSDKLTIKGEKKEEKEEKKKDYYLSERKYGSFERSFRVPESVDANKIEANFKNGVLKVTLPKKAEAQKPVKTIEVKAA
jgi:HSP20 family protein